MKLLLIRLNMLLYDAKKLTTKHGLSVEEKEGIINDISRLMEKIQIFINEGK